MKHIRDIVMAVIAMGCCIGQARAQTGSGDSVAAQANTDTVAPRDTSAPRDTVAPSLKKHPKRSHLEVGATYQSNNVYLGRKDSSALPYIVPTISYYHKSGLYFTAGLAYLKSSSVSRVDLFTLDAGYMFTKNKYNGMFTVSKYFYNSQSTNVSSTIRAAIAYQNSYDLGIIKPSLTMMANIGDKTDLESLFEISHDFSLLHENLDIVPTLAVGGSTLHFYDYYRQRRYKTKKKNQPPQTGIADVTGSVEQASRFRLMDYEASLPVEYSIGKCTFSFTPTWCIPVNAATIDIHTVRDNGQIINKTSAESISNSFFFTAGVSFLF